VTPPRSVTTAAGLASLTAALTTVLWTTTDFASTTVTMPPPPAAPAGATPEEWERALTARSSGPDPDPMTNLDLFALLYDGRLIALALTGIVLWLVVAVAAVRGWDSARFLAAAVAAGQAPMLLVMAAGSAPAVYAVTGALIVAGAMSAALLFRAASIAHVRTTSRPHSTAALVS